MSTNVQRREKSDRGAIAFGYRTAVRSARVTCQKFRLIDIDGDTIVWLVLLYSFT
jgi:hypothetical protein